MSGMILGTIARQNPCAGAPTVVSVSLVKKTNGTCDLPNPSGAEYTITVTLSADLTSGFDLRVGASWRSSSGSPSYSPDHTFTSADGSGPYAYDSNFGGTLDFYDLDGGSETQYAQVQAEVVPAGETSPACDSDVSSEVTESSVLTCGGM